MTAMRMVDVFKVLLGGGWICSIDPSVGNRVRYTVHSPWRKTPSPAGHITPKMFDELVESGVIISTNNQKKDKYGNIYTWYELAKPTDIADMR